MQITGMGTGWQLAKSRVSMESYVKLYLESVQTDHSNFACSRFVVRKYFSREDFDPFTLFCLVSFHSLSKCIALSKQALVVQLCNAVRSISAVATR